MTQQEINQAVAKIQQIAKCDYEWAVECLSELNRCGLEASEKNIAEYVEYFEYDGRA